MNTHIQISADTFSPSSYFGIDVFNTDGGAYIHSNGLVHCSARDTMDRGCGVFADDIIPADTYIGIYDGVVSSVEPDEHSHAIEISADAMNIRVGCRPPETRPLVVSKVMTETEYRKMDAFLKSFNSTSVFVRKADATDGSCYEPPRAYMINEPKPGEEANVVFDPTGLVKAVREIQTGEQLLVSYGPRYDRDYAVADDARAFLHADPTVLSARGFTIFTYSHDSTKKSSTDVIVPLGESHSRAVFVL